MNLSQEIKTTGRVDRTGFWARHLTLVPLSLWATSAAGDSPGAPFDLAFVALTIAVLVSTWGRRLHDRGHSAWWLLAVFVPVLGALALMVECGLRGIGRNAGRFGPTPGLRSDYVVVGGASDVEAAP